MNQDDEKQPVPREDIPGNVFHTYEIGPRKEPSELAKQVLKNQQERLRRERRNSQRRPEE